MEPIAILHADPLDILFENRNKSYGAYPLRKYYRQRLFISLGCTFLLTILCSLGWLYFKTPPLLVKIFNVPDAQIIDLIQPPPKPVSPPSKPSALKPPATIQHTIPIIVADNKPIKPIATIDELKTSSISLKTMAGKQDDGRVNNTVSSSGTGSYKMDSVESKPEIYEYPEVMPEFPGGIEALKRYLTKNLRMPENNLETGAQIRVMARFVVGEDGRVRDIEITQASDKIFNMEVERVILKMPNWKPGEQNHHPVSVYFKLPVNFVNAE